MMTGYRPFCSEPGDAAIVIIKIQNNDSAADWIGRWLSQSNLSLLSAKILVTKSYWLRDAIFFILSIFSFWSSTR